MCKKLLIGLSSDSKPESRVNIMVTRGEREGGINWGIGVDIHTVLYIK